MSSLPNCITSTPTTTTITTTKRFLSCVERGCVCLCRTTMSDVHGRGGIVSKGTERNRLGFLVKTIEFYTYQITAIHSFYLFTIGRASSRNNNTDILEFPANASERVVFNVENDDILKQSFLCEQSNRKIGAVHNLEKHHHSYNDIKIQLFRTKLLIISAKRVSVSSTNAPPKARRDNNHSVLPSFPSPLPTFAAMWDQKRICGQNPNYFVWFCICT